MTSVASVEQGQNQHVVLVCDLALVPLVEPYLTENLFELNAWLDSGENADIVLCDARTDECAVARIREHDSQAFIVAVVDSLMSETAQRLRAGHADAVLSESELRGERLLSLVKQRCDNRERKGSFFDLASVHQYDRNELIRHVTFLQNLLDSVPQLMFCLLYTSPSPRDLSTSRMPSSA